MLFIYVWFLKMLFSNLLYAVPSFDKFSYSSLAGTSISVLASLLLSLNLDPR